MRLEGKKITVYSLQNTRLHHCCVLSYFEGTENLHCYTSCTLTTLHCRKVSFLQCCHMKRYNKIFTKVRGVLTSMRYCIFVYTYVYVYIMSNMLIMYHQYIHHLESVIASGMLTYKWINLLVCVISS